MTDTYQRIKRSFDEIKIGISANSTREMNSSINTIFSNTLPFITIKEIFEKMDELEKMIENLENNSETIQILEKVYNKLVTFSTISITYWINDPLFNGGYPLNHFLNYLGQIENILLRIQINRILTFPNALSYQAEFQNFQNIYNEVLSHQQLITDASNTLFDFNQWRNDLDFNMSIISSGVENSRKETESINKLLSNANGYIASMNRLEIEAKGILKSCNDAFSASTTVGLAKSFSDKAAQLQWIMLGWVILLFGALYVGINFGTTRLDTLINELDVVTKVSKSIPTETITINWSVVLIKLILVIISFGGTIWAAWLATKQIGMYFRLSEDYGYKSALAKAYSGYKSEAGRIDETLYNKLFSIALDRLDESPIRLVDNKEDKNTPIQEFLESKMFSKIIEVAPQLKDDLVALLKSYGKKDVEKKSEVKEVKKD
ncbi:hypothetical protein [Flectobacillus roseus]|uniref:Uncharacterized protein n=1 Tax=Flectobacillus roseus TaxID=502259 RepID=A0ABT6Y8P4_9BACT|nr:hypothetical protein [Flectobacillus roseus]MDI9859896.1 hypothetical protein [Flectobacillus roseus]